MEALGSFFRGVAAGASLAAGCSVLLAAWIVSRRKGNADQLPALPSRTHILTAEEQHAMARSIAEATAVAWPDVQDRVKIVSRYTTMGLLPMSVGLLALKIITGEITLGVKEGATSD